MLKSSKIRLSIAILFLFFCLLICLFSYNKFYVNQKSAKFSSLTNPLLKYIEFHELRSFRDKVEALINQQKEQGLVEDVAVYFRSMTDGIWFGINEREKFTPASLLKVPVVVAYLKAAEKGPQVLEKKIKYEILTDDSSQYVRPTSLLKAGEYYTVNQLIEAMIGESDNNAYFLLTENINADILAETFANLGIANALYKTGDFVSLKTLVGMYRVLYNASYLNRKASEKALRYLVNAKYKGGIVAGVPKDIIVAHKFGERTKLDKITKQLHDIGIVYYPENPYLLGIMTKGKDFQNLAKVIKEISALIYSEVDNQYKEQKEHDYEISK